MRAASDTCWWASTPPPPPSMELVPLGHAAEPSVIDVGLVTDPLPRLEQLSQSRRRWCLFALLMTAGFVVIAAIGIVQYANVLVTCKLLKEARDHAEQTRDDTQRALVENRKICAQLMEDRRDLKQTESHVDLALHAFSRATREAVVTQAENQRIYDRYVADRAELKQLKDQADRTLKTFRTQALAALTEDPRFAIALDAARAEAGEAVVAVQREGEKQAARLRFVTEQQADVHAAILRFWAFDQAAMLQFLVEDLRLIEPTEKANPFIPVAPPGPKTDDE